MKKISKSFFIMLVAIVIIVTFLFYTATPKYARAAGVRTISDTGGNWNDPTAWDEGSVPTSTNDVVATATSGNLTINVTAAAKSIDLTNYTGTLTHNAFTLTVSGSIKFVAGMTYTPLATSKITMATDGALTTAGKLMPLVTCSSGTMILGDNLSFMASKVMVLTISGTAIDLAGKTVSGNSDINRVLITSGTLGTPASITVNSGTFANADFRDILFANGGTDLNLVAITGLSGDCGGNTMSGGGTLTFTTTSTQTWSGVMGSWSDNTKWTSRIPLPQDTVVLAGTNVATADMPRLGKDIFFSAAAKLTLGNDVTSYGSLNFTNAGTFTSNPYNWYFESMSRTGTNTLTTNGKTFARGVSIQTVGATLQLAGTLSCSTITFSNGTFNDAGNSISTTYISISGANVARGVTKTGNWTLTRSTGGSVWIVGATLGLTWSDTGGSITISNTGANAKTFAGAGLTYNNLAITGGGTGAVIITGSNTFNDFIIGAPKTVTFPSTVTTTINGTFTAVGTAGNVITINSDSAGSAAILSKASGIVIGDYLSIKDSAVTGGAVWSAGSHSTDVSGNSGWIFRSPEIVSNAGGNWSEAAAWVGGVVPTADDYVFTTATSGNLTIDVNATCRNIDLTNYTGILTHASGVTLSVGNASGGSLKFVTGMTYTLGSNTTSIINFVSTATNNTIFWGGKSVGSVIFNGVGGGWNFQDAATINSNFTVTNSDTVGNGVNLNNQAVSIGGNLQMDAGKLTIGCTPLLVTGSRIINGGTLVDNQSGTYYFKLSIDSAIHNDYGAAYPITYNFYIPPNSSNLKVYKRYTSSQSWSQITEKTSSDSFNAIEAVRFDYPHNQAYISVAFSDVSDEIYLKITNNSGNNVCANYQDIPDYYDNRDAVVTVTADDWYHTNDSAFEAASDAFTSRSIWFSPGIITNYVPISWSIIQNKIDAGYIEPVSHSRNHPNPPYSDYDSEIGGSRDDIINNLDLPTINKKGDQEYVYGWLEPNGNSDSTIHAKLGQYKYLADRNSGSSDVFATWDEVNNVFNSIGSSYIYGGGDLVSANNKFDSVVSAGGIYHLFGHPQGIAWTPGSWILDHLDYIKQKTNLWYVGFGHLYLYHYLDSQNKVSVEKVEEVATVTHGSKKKAVSEINPPTIPVSTEILTNESIVAEITNTLHDYNVSAPIASFTMSADNITGSTVTFDASGSTSNKGIIKYEWDFGDGTTAEGIRVEYKYQSPGQYTVKLTVTDRAGNKNTTTKTVEIKPNAPTITNITAKGTALWIEGKSDPGTIIHFTIHSNPFEGQGLANKDGYWTYYLDNASEIIGEGDHTIVAQAAVKLADNSELLSVPSKTYDFKMSVDDGKLKVEMKKTRVWQYISLGLVLLIVVGFVLNRVRKRKLTSR